MNMILSLLGVVIRVLLFFTVVRNITRNKYYGWGAQDYGGIVLILIVLAFSWFTGYGPQRLVLMIFLIGTIIAAIFEGMGNRKAALISGIVGALLILYLMGGF